MGHLPSFLHESHFILARVSSISQSRLKKQIAINKGSSDGIKIGQVVLNSNCLMD
jgi:rod shape-determining protein MreC